jgi:hypothetical protein
VPRSFHSSLFDHPDNIWSAVEIIKRLIMQSSPIPYCVVPFGFKLFSLAPYSRTSSTGAVNLLACLAFSQLNKGGELFLSLGVKQVRISKSPLAEDVKV